MISSDAPMEGPTFFEAVVVEQATLGLAPYGLSLARSTPTLVRFASADVFVDFFLDPRSLEVGAEIGLRPEVDYREGARREGESFSIGRPTIRNAFSLEQILKYYRDDQSDTDTVGSFTLENIAKLPAAFSELLRACSNTPRHSYEETSALLCYSEIGFHWRPRHLPNQCRRRILE